MSILEEIRVNRTPTHMVRPAALELQKKTKVIMGEYVEREKLPGEVKAADNDLGPRRLPFRRWRQYAAGAESRQPGCVQLA